METLEQKHAELDVRLARLKKSQRIHYLYTLVILVLGMGIGYAIAQYVIDPVTILTTCGGIEV